MLRTADIRSHFDDVVKWQRNYKEASRSLGQSVSTFFGSAQYQNIQAAVGKKYAAWLMQPENLPAMTSAYPSLSEERQIAFLQKCADKHGSLYAQETGLSLKGIKVVPLLEKGKTWMSNIVRHMRAHTPAYDVTEINTGVTNSNGTRDVLTDVALVTKSHVQHFDNHLARLFRQGLLPADHPLAADAEYLDGLKKTFLLLPPAPTSKKKAKSTDQVNPVRPTRHRRGINMDTNACVRFWKRLDLGELRPPLRGPVRRGELTADFQAVAAMNDGIKTMAKPFAAFLRTVDGSAAYRKTIKGALQDVSSGLEQAPLFAALKAQPVDPRNDATNKLLQQTVDRLAGFLRAASGVNVTGTKMKWQDGKATEGIWGKSGYRDIVFNPVLCKGESLARVLELATHETIHQFNNCLGRAYKAGRLPPGHPLYADAAYFHEMNSRHAVVTRPYAAYRAQFDERTAQKFGTDVKAEAIALGAAAEFKKAVCEEKNDSQTHSRPEPKKESPPSLEIAA